MKQKKGDVDKRKVDRRQENHINDIIRFQYIYMYGP